MNHPTFRSLKKIVATPELLATFFQFTGKVTIELINPLPPQAKLVNGSITPDQVVLIYEDASFKPLSFLAEIPNHEIKIKRHFHSDHGWLEDFEIRKAQIKLLKDALYLQCKVVDDLMDKLEIEHFGPETDRSVSLAVAATKYGIAQEGDSAFDLDGMTLEQARAVNGK